MRLIGHLGEKSDARVLSDYFYSKGVENEVEETEEGWAIWIHHDDHVDMAKKDLEAYRQDPSAEKFQRGAEEGQRRWKQEKVEDKKSRRKLVDVRTTWGSGNNTHDVSQSFLTVGLVIISIGVFAMGLFQTPFDLRDILFISTPGSGRHLIPPEVLGGQIWRLVTPIFLHFGLLHIFFNLMWLSELGTLVETRHGTLFLGMLIAVLSVFPNLAEYYVTGPAFGGMSGVVYGLLGFVWIRGKMDPNVGYQLPRHIVVMMMVWFVLCLTVIPNIANMAHAAGLLLGAGIGALTAILARRAS